MHYLNSEQSTLKVFAPQLLCKHTIRSGHNHHTSYCANVSLGAVLSAALMFLSQTGRQAIDSSRESLSYINCMPSEVTWLQLEQLDSACQLRSLMILIVGLVTIMHQSI